MVKPLENRESFSHLLSYRACVLAPTTYSDDMSFSLETISQEYPLNGGTDFREDALRIKSIDGSIYKCINV